MLKRIIPGHVRAHTAWVVLILGVVTLLVTHSATQTLGTVLLVLGMFIGDQATHLAQENHRDEQSTWIEKQLQNHRWVSALCGWVIALCGLVLIL